ncbi:MAG: sulfite exporter TauE/SafE family protein, partial [Halonotius sp.]
MIAGFSSTFLVILTVVLLVAGTVNGLAGFGFALVGTMALATVIAPSTAVVLMIIPILSANVTLVSELSVAELQSCGQRFWPLILAALIGTILGMVII